MGEQEVGESIEIKLDESTQRLMELQSTSPSADLQSLSGHSPSGIVLDSCTGNKV